jgi:hypothetical protein
MHGTAVQPTASTVFEPSLQAVFLPRCGACHHMNPLAMQPPRPAGVCPGCGEPSAGAAPPVTVEAFLTGRDPATLLGRALLAIGRWFANLAKGL